MINDEQLALGELASSPVRLGALPPSVEAFLSGELQIVEQTSGHTPGLPAAMCVAPLIRRGHAIGVLALYWAEAHRPDEHELRMVRTAARFVALVIETTTDADAARAELEDARGAARVEAARATAAAELARFQDAATALLCGGEPVQDALVPLLAEHGVANPRIESAASDRDPARRRVAVSGALRTHASLTWDSGVPIDSAVPEFAARILAVDRDRQDRERALSALGPRALATLADESAADSAVREAESFLGLDEAPAHGLLVVAYRSAEDAFASARDLEFDSGLAQAGLTAVAVGAQVLAIGASAALLNTAQDRLAVASGHRGSGLSGPVAEGDGRRRVAEARTASRISEARGGRLVRHADVGRLLELTSSVPDRVARALVAELIGPLDAYDHQHGTQLVDTLSTYLAQNGAVQQTATRMHLHVNTVKQRIERINRILGEDVRDYTLVGRLLMALEWRSLLKDAPP